MITQHNVFIRRFGHLAVVITVTDWNQYQNLMKYANEGNDNPDFLMGASTTSTIYSNMLPATTINVHSAKDISEKTHGSSIDGILTGNFNPAGRIWSFRTVKDPLLGGLISEQKEIKLDTK